MDDETLPEEEGLDPEAGYEGPDDDSYDPEAEDLEARIEREVQARLAERSRTERRSVREEAGRRRETAPETPYGLPPMPVYSDEEKEFYEDLMVQGEHLKAQQFADRKRHDWQEARRVVSTRAWRSQVRSLRENLDEDVWAEYRDDFEEAALEVPQEAMVTPGTAEQLFAYVVGSKTMRSRGRRPGSSEDEDDERPRDARGRYRARDEDEEEEPRRREPRKPLEPEGRMPRGSAARPSRSPGRGSDREEFRKSIGRSLGSISDEDLDLLLAPSTTRRGER